MRRSQHRNKCKSGGRKERLQPNLMSLKRGTTVLRKCYADQRKRGWQQQHFQSQTIDVDLLPDIGGLVEELFGNEDTQAEIIETVNVSQSRAFRIYNDMPKWQRSHNRTYAQNTCAHSFYLICYWFICCSRCDGQSEPQFWAHATIIQQFSRRPYTTPRTCAH